MKKNLLGLLFLVFTSSSASAYTSISVFGDSFFDGGDTDTAVVSYFKLFGGGVTPPPYANFRFTNGPTSAEYLATNLGMNDTSHFFNFAVGGAKTSNILSGVTDYLATNPTLDSQGLFVINGGGNDLAVTPNSITATSAAKNITDSIVALNASGAKNFLVIGLPILGTSPAFNGAPQADIDALAALSAEFNSALSNGINLLPLTGNTKIMLFDTVGVLNQGRVDAAANGITNTSDACLINGVACANPDTYIFWDGIHLTTKVHSYLGEAMTEFVTPTSAVPEPETYSMLLAGLFLLGYVKSRRQNSSPA